MNEIYSLPALKSGEVQWHRVSATAQMQEATLFGNNYIQPHDIIQGTDIRNCWLMTSLSAMAEYPGRIENMFLNKEKSTNGIYAVQMWALNVPITVMIDDYLPLDAAMDSTFFARISDDRSLWVPIIEEAT